MTGTVEFVQKIRYVEVTDENGEQQVYAIPETVENVQELIRCKDCKNACVYDDDEVICTHIDSNGNDKHPADWFCADVVKRDD